jgi:hypothetical protein
MEMCLHHPEPLVDAARNLGEHVGRVQVTQLVGLVDGFPRRRAECRQSRGEAIDVTFDLPTRLLNQACPVDSVRGRIIEVNGIPSS